MRNTNVELSKNELELVTSRDFILTKNRIIEKVYDLFGTLSEEYKQLLDAHADGLPAAIFEKAPKIYRGEQYLGLPYVMMDYPRLFLKEDVFAIRSFFWWGNYFSITLQLGGIYEKRFSGNIINYLDTNKNDNWYVGVNQSAWEHHFEKDNYLPLEDIRSLPGLINNAFIKIAKKLMLTEWGSAEEFFVKTYRELLKATGQ